MGGITDGDGVRGASVMAISPQNVRQVQATDRPMNRVDQQHKVRGLALYEALGHTFTIDGFDRSGGSLGQVLRVAGWGLKGRQNRKRVVAEILHTRRHVVQQAS